MWQPCSLRALSRDKQIKEASRDDLDLEDLVMEEDGIMGGKLIVKLNHKRLKIIENYQ